MADECYGKRDGCVHGEQNSFGRARFLLTPSLIRATVRVWRWACDVHCILQLQFTFPSFLPSFERKMRYRSWGSNVVMGSQYNYSLIGSFFRAYVLQRVVHESDVQLGCGLDTQHEVTVR